MHSHIGGLSSLTAQVNTWLERCLEAPSSVEQLYTYAERHLAGNRMRPSCR